jgi:hypothetical protein
MHAGDAHVASLSFDDGRLDQIHRARKINGVDSHAQNIRTGFLSRRCD